MLLLQGLGVRQLRRFSLTPSRRSPWRARSLLPRPSRGRPASRRASRVALRLVKTPSCGHRRHRARGLSRHVDRVASRRRRGEARSRGRRRRRRRRRGVAPSGPGSISALDLLILPCAFWAVERTIQPSAGAPLTTCTCPRRSWPFDTLHHVLNLGRSQKNLYLSLALPRMKCLLFS